LASQLDTTVRGMNALLDMSALAAARFFEKFGDFMTERFKLFSIFRKV